MSNLVACARAVTDKVTDCIFHPTQQRRKVNRMKRTEEVPTKSYFQMAFYFVNPVSYTEIIPNQIWLGNSITAANWGVIKKHDIQVIFNATVECRNYFEGYIEYERFKMRDDNDVDFAHIIPQVLTAIKRHEGKRILIHCWAGASRSAAIVALICLVRGYYPTVEAAIENIQSKRPEVHLNEKLFDALKEFEKGYITHE